MTLATLYGFLSDLIAGLVLALGGLVVKKLCNKKTTHDPDHVDEGHSLGQ